MWIIQSFISSAGTEPDAIHEVMEALDPLVLGQTLTGAGGGGFLVLLTKEPNMADKIKAVIQEKKVLEFFIILEHAILSQHYIKIKMTFYSGLQPL